MSNVSKRKKEGSRTKIKTMGDHQEFLKRISKTLYYGQLPSLPCLSLPVTEISCAAWSGAQRGRSLRRLHADAAAGVARAACVSPCALVLALLYLERLKRCNPDYLAAAAPSDLFLVSLMVSNKFLQDDGEEDEVICSEWAASGGLELGQLKKLEIEFLNAIEWNVFVSEESFARGLEWLEWEVALKQARLHGFFTYTDLAAARGAALLPGLARALAAAALAYLAALAALLAAALLLAHARSAPASAPAALTDPAAPAARAPGLPVAGLAASNDTTDALEELAEAAAARLACCDGWGAPEPEWARGPAAPESAWTRGPAVPEPPGWLLDAARPWLERLGQYAGRPPAALARLGRLAVLLASLSDR